MLTWVLGLLLGWLVAGALVSVVLAALFRGADRDYRALSGARRTEPRRDPPVRTSAGR